MAPQKVSTITELFQIPNTSIPETVLKYLNTDSFLAFRLVCKAWGQIWWDNLQVCHLHHERVGRMLILAAKEGLVERARFLISKGIDVDTRDAVRNTALHMVKM